MPRLRAGVLDELALLAHATDTERALRLHHEALRIRIDHDLVLGYLASLESLALLHLRRGAAEVAGVLAGAAERGRSDLSTAPGLSVRVVDRVVDEEPPAGIWLGQPDPDRAGCRRTRRAGPVQSRDRRPPVRQPGHGETHLAHAYAQLQVANRTELARLAAEHLGQHHLPAQHQ
jgi:hypothetical protein